MALLSTRTLAITAFSMRIAYGAALLGAPERTGRPWLGSSADTAPTQVALRGIGGREVVVHGLATAAAIRRTTLRPWLVGSIAGDLTDLCSTVAGRRSLPDGTVRRTAAATGGAALISAALWAFSD